MNENNVMVVPYNIHFIWFAKENSEFRFDNLLSILSAYYLAKPQNIFFYCDEEPKGKFWLEVKDRVKMLRLIHYKAPMRVFGESGPRIHYVEHQSDIARIDILKHQGGIYLDLDVLTLKPYTKLLYYNFTMGLEYKGNPGRLNNGIILSRPNATFLELWHKTYKSFEWNEWDEHSCQETYKLAEKYPNLVHVEEKTLNYPSGPMKHLIYEVSHFNWSNNYAIHLWSRLHKKAYTPETIKNLNTTFGKLARLIYYENSTNLGGD